MMYQDTAFLLFLLFGFSIASIPLLFNKFFVRSKHHVHKEAPYECGFESASDARFQFDIRFYRVALLFLLFDIEMIFLFPWAILVRDGLEFEEIFSMFFFLFLLLIGFFYEWRKGALEWD